MYRAVYNRTPVCFVAVCLRIEYPFLLAWFNVFTLVVLFPCNYLSPIQRVHPDSIIDQYSFHKLYNSMSPPRKHLPRASQTLVDYHQIRKNRMATDHVYRNQQNARKASNQRKRRAKVLVTNGSIPHRIPQDRNIISDLPTGDFFPQSLLFLIIHTCFLTLIHLSLSCYCFA